MPEITPQQGEKTPVAATNLGALASGNGNAAAANGNKNVNGAGASEEKPAAYSLDGQVSGQSGPTFLEKLVGKTSAGASINAPSIGASSAPTVIPSIASLLGPKPVFSSTAFSAEKEQHSAGIAKTLAGIAFLIALGTYSFFYSQTNADFTWLDSQFGPNVAAGFERSNAELQSKQTDLNLVRFRMARLLLDEVNGQIDAFQLQNSIVKSASASAAQKQIAQTQRQILGAGIKRSLADVQKIFNRPLGIDVYSPAPVTPEERETLYESLLKERLAKEKSALQKDANPNLAEMRLIDNVLRLVENRSFRAFMRSRDLARISEDDFGGMLASIREEGTDELSSIDKIKSARLNWRQVIENVHAVTSKADPYYGQGLFKTVGGFLFSSYRFDAKTGRISLAGMTKSSDSKMFSAIARLVDAIEKSVYFKDIDFRSFSKNKDESGDFSSSLNLEFSIQKGKDPRDDIIASENPPASAPSISTPRPSQGSANTLSRPTP